jgi:hypothetical protein
MGFEHLRIRLLREIFTIRQDTTSPIPLIFIYGRSLTDYKFAVQIVCLKSVDNFGDISTEGRFII